MPVGAVSPNLTNLEGKKGTRDLGTELGKDDFLKLLITKMKYQNPVEPSPDEEFIADLAQFSALEQMTNLNKNIEMFLNQATSLRLQVLPLLGKSVIARNPDGGEDLKGTIDRIRFVAGVAKLTINGVEIGIEDIKEVSVE
jgi:flagellar basal-body rod modification protein FlgD